MRRGRGYDETALTEVYTSDKAWARFVLRQLQRHVDNLSAIRYLGFVAICSSTGSATPPAARARAEYRSRPAGDVSDDASAPKTAWLAPCLFPPGIASVVLAELGSRRRRCSLSAAGGPSGC